MMGAANLGLAVNKAPELGAVVWGLSVTGAGVPAAAVLAVYGTTSIFGQGLSGSAQLYSAATGNYGTPGGWPSLAFVPFPDHKFGCPTLATYFAARVGFTNLRPAALERSRLVHLHSAQNAAEKF